MAAVLSLLVHGWIPVSVIEDDVASPCQIKTNASRTSTTYKAQHSRVVVKSFHNSLSQLSLGVPVKPNVVELKHIQDLLENVQHLSHLSKDKHLLAAIFDGSQKKDHFNEFTAIVEDDIFVWKMQ